MATKKPRLSPEEEHELNSKLVQQQAAAMRASMDGMAILDRDGKYVFLNEAHARIHGYERPEDLIGRHYSDVFPEGEYPRFEAEVMAEFWKTGRWHGEGVGRRKDGTTFPKEISLSRIDDEDGNATGMVAVVRDVTERKRAEREHARLLELEKTARAEAEAASRSKDEFLAVVSHELRTPMTAILGWTWLLRSGDVERGELDKALEVIDRNMKLQAQIIEDLLDVSSIVTGKLHLDIKAVDLAEVLNKALASVKETSDRQDVKLETDFAPKVRVSGDAHRLQQVFWNLLSNAVKFNKKGGKVLTTLAVDEGCAAITIEDDGQGIDPSVLPEIFDPFRQAEDSLTREHRGLGLGLAIVRHLVELHGGSVSASSGGKDQGSSFTVLLPLLPEGAAAEPAKAAAPPRPAREGTLQGVKIVLVDDEPDTVAVLSEVLKTTGAVVTKAYSAQEARDAMAREMPKILISDLAMPGEDGYTLIRKLRDVTGGGRVRALALSARAGDEDRAKALEAGFDQFLSKPVDLDELVSALKALAS